MRVKLSPGERFISWFPLETKLYIRGERGKSPAESDRLFAEVARQFNEFHEKVFESERRALQAKLERCRDALGEILRNGDMSASEIRELANLLGETGAA